MNYRHLLLGVLMMALVACGAKDNALKPTPLKPIVPTARVQMDWTNHIDQGNDGQYYFLGPGLSAYVLAAVNPHGTLGVYDRVAGKAYWDYPSDYVFSTSPVVDEKRLFTGTLYGQAVAFDLPAAEIKWTKQLSSSVLTPPAVRGDRVVYQSHDGTVTALDASDGHVLWTFQTPTPGLTLQQDTKPVMDDAFVYAGFANGHVKALGVADGQPRWDVMVGTSRGLAVAEQIIDVGQHMVLADDALFASAFHGNVVRIDRSTGQVIWEFDAAVAQGIAVSDRAVIFTDVDSRVIALDKETGQKLWEQPALLGRSLTVPTVLGQYAVLGDYQGYLHVLSLADGKLAGRHRFAYSPIGSKIGRYGGHAYVVTQSGEIGSFQVQAVGG